MSWFFKWIKKLIKSVLKAISKLLSSLGPLLPLLMVALFVFAPAIAVVLLEWGAPAWLASGVVAVGSVVTTFGPYVAAGVGLLTSTLISPEATTQLAEVVGEIASDVGQVIGEVIGSTASSLFATLPTWVTVGGIAFLGFWLLKDQNEGSAHVESQQPSLS